MIGSGYRRSLGLMKTHAGETKSELMIVQSLTMKHTTNSTDDTDTDDAKGQ